MLLWLQNFWITTVGGLSNDDGDVNERGRVSLPPRALARLKGRYGIARECSHFNRGRVSLPPRPEARLKKDTGLLASALTSTAESVAATSSRSSPKERYEIAQISLR